MDQKPKTKDMDSGFTFFAASYKDRSYWWGHAPYVILECVCGSTTAIPREIVERLDVEVGCCGGLDPNCNRRFNGKLLLRKADRDGFVTFLNDQPKRITYNSDRIVNALSERLAP